MKGPSPVTKQGEFAYLNRCLGDFRATSCPDLCGGSYQLFHPPVSCPRHLSKAPFPLGCFPAPRGPEDKTTVLTWAFPEFRMRKNRLGFQHPYSRSLFQNLIWLHVSQSPITALSPPPSTPCQKTKNKPKTMLDSHLPMQTLGFLQSRPGQNQGLRQELYFKGEELGLNDSVKDKPSFIHQKPWIELLLCAFVPFQMLEIQKEAKKKWLAWR